MTGLIYVSTNSVQGPLCFTHPGSYFIPFISPMITILTGVRESLQFSFAFSWCLVMLSIFSLSQLAVCMLSFGSLSSSEWRQMHTLLWCLCKHQECLGTLSLNGNSIFKLMCYISSQFCHEIWERVFGDTCLKLSRVSRKFRSVEERESHVELCSTIC